MKKMIERYKNISLPAKATLWFLICSVIQKGISFFTTPIFTRIMTTDNYGVAVLYTSWLEVISIIITLHLTAGVFNNAMSKYEKERDSYTSSILFLVTCMIFAWFLVYLINPSFWNSLIKLETRVIIMMFIDIFFSTTMALWSIRNRYEYKYKNVIFFTLLANILGPISSIILVLISPAELKVEAKIAGTVLVKALVYSVVYYLIMRKGKKLVNKKHWIYSIRYNLPLVPHYLSEQVLTHSDRIMIGMICGLSAAALYGVAYQLSMTLFIVTLAIHNSYTPWTYENIKVKRYARISDITLKIELLIGSMCFLFSLFAPEVIYFLGGAEYMASVWIVPPVTMSILFQTLYSCFSTVEFYFEKTKVIMISSIVCALSNLVLNYIFIPIYGFVAAGYTTLVCYILYCFVHYIAMKKICKEKNIEGIFNGNIMWMIAILFASLSIVSSFLYSYFIVRYIVILLLAILIFLLAIKNKKVIKEFLSKKK